MPAFLDLTGQTFTYLKVLKRGKDYVRPGDSRPTVRWECRCKCGNRVLVGASDLRGGHTNSCGCYQKKMAKQAKTTHGQSSSDTYRTWQAMHRRCSNPNTRDYPDYGGRGITVCPRWAKFANFLADMGERPPGKEIDRIDNNKGYSKSNCRWVTHKQNTNNHRRNVRIKHKGREQTLTQWLEELNIHRTTYYWRINKLGWSQKRALFTPSTTR